MYEFHNDYMLSKYEQCLKLCYMDTDSFIQDIKTDNFYFIQDIKTDNFYKDIAKDVEAKLNTSGYSTNCPLPIGVNKKVIGLTKMNLAGES